MTKSHLAPRPQNSLLVQLGSGNTPNNTPPQKPDSSSPISGRHTHCQQKVNMVVVPTTPVAYMRFDIDPKYSFQPDIWTLGCTICEFFSEYPLFYHGYSGNDQIIAKEVDILGKPPQNWWEKWEARHQFFTETGERLSSKWQHPSWESHFEEDIQRSRREAWMPELDVEERDALMELFQCMLCWEPEKQLTIQGVLDSKWMRKWALPEYERAFEK